MSSSILLNTRLPCAAATREEERVWLRRADFRRLVNDPMFGS